MPRSRPERWPQDPAFFAWALRACSRVLATAALLSIMLPAVASAADAPAATAKKSAKGSAKGSGKSKRSVVKTGKNRAGGKKVISLEDDFLVEGKLDKPSAFFILKRSAADY
ncbi:MAG TPA: hypothetical protein ENJ18_00645, partial [Nannocystis exedens]|nr:hypothetical protein [Nannocystis exedens]